MRFGRAEVKAVRADMQKALDVVAQKYGISITVGNASFTDTYVNFKVQAATKLTDGVLATPEAANFRAWAKMYGYDPELLGKEVRFMGHTYTITGLNRRRKAYPISVTRADGKQYKWTLPQFKSAVPVK